MAAMTLTGPVSPVEARPIPKAKGSVELGAAVRPPTASTTASVASVDAIAVSSTTPTVYVVASGDTVSSIAGQFGLSTASVLALNGLGWSSLIFPGQELRLSTESVASIPPASEPATESVAATTASSSYSIVAGDTISAIADTFGIPVLSLLAANGLGWSSIIYPDQTLVIPGQVGGIDTSEAIDIAPHAAALQTGSDATVQAPTTPVVETTPTPPSAPEVSPSTLTDEMRANAAVIVRVGRSLGVSDYGIEIALATAMQESSLRNLSWGDLDSVGLFQQRPSAGWGSVDQLTDPDHAARLFYGGASNPNLGQTRGLLDISGWQSLPLTVAAQKVQISAHPDAYARWESSAREWLAELG